MIRFICVAIFSGGLPDSFHSGLLRGMADRKEKPGNEGFFFPADCPVGISLYPADRWRRDYSDRP